MLVSLRTVDCSNKQFQHLDKSVECLVTYLKQQNMNDEFFNKVKPLYSLTEACLKGVESEKEQLFNVAQLNLRNDGNKNCFAESLGQEAYKNLLLKIRAIESISEGIVNRIVGIWNDRRTSKQLALERVNEEAFIFFSSAELNCKLKCGFEEVFESFFEVDNEENSFVPHEEVEDFCIKKKLMELQLIDPVQYSLKPYPETIKTENLGCEKVLESMKANLIASLREFQSERIQKEKVRCVFSVLKEGDKYLNLILKTEVLSKASLSLQQKQEEKKNFVDKMVEISLKINNECVNG